VLLAIRRPVPDRLPLLARRTEVALVVGLGQLERVVLARGPLPAQQTSLVPRAGRKRGQPARNETRLLIYNSGGSRVSLPVHARQAGVSDGGAMVTRGFSTISVAP
jgi:hypothetical protein